MAYRPLRRSPRLAALITAIGMSIFLQNLAMIIWGGRPLPFTRAELPAYFTQPALTLGDARLTWLQLLIWLLALVLMAGLTLIIHKTQVGKAMRAISQNQTMAALLGINVNRVITFTFALAGALGAAAVVLVGVTKLVDPCWLHAGQGLRGGVLGHRPSRPSCGLSGGARPCAATEALYRYGSPTR